MDRAIVYPGALALDTDEIAPQQDAMIAAGYLAQTMVGTSVAAVGLACLPTSPASLVVNIGAGAITSLTEIDPNAYGSLGTNTNPLVKMGINQAATPFTLTAPSVSGQSINYLIEATFLEQDGTPVVLPYYNSANVNQPFSGPPASGVSSGTAQNTKRAQTVSLQLKAGAAASSGSQTTPATDSGWSPLYIITVNYGQTQITSSSIAVAPGAPFFDGGSILAAVQMVGKRQVSFETPGAFGFTVPQGVYQLRATVTGGGGGGSDCSAPFPSTGTNNVSGGGGGAGGTTIGSIAVTPGQVITGVVGAGGTAQLNGGTSSFASLSATGGGGSSFQVAASSAGAEGGSGSGGNVNIMGGFGSDGQCGAATSFGNGGASFWGGGVRAYNAGNAPLAANGAPGGGGGGAYNGPSSGTVYAGTSGIAGIVVLEY